MSELSAITGLRIRLASPEQIRMWSSGEVTKPDTINYLTNQPERDGLFCERIFGPIHDWICACGKYRHERTAGFVCERCGVDVVLSRVRRERMGHIELVAPIAHSWFARGVPSILALLLDLSPRQLASVLDYSGYLVTMIKEDAREEALDHLDEEAETGRELHQLLARIAVGTFLDEASYRNLSELYDHCFHAQTGGEAIRRVLTTLDLIALAASLQQTIRTGGTKQKKAIKRLHIVEAFRRSGVNPAWMMLSVLPVLPPDLRPLVPLGGGRFATSDLNTLYERVIHRNIRLQHFIEHGAPEAVLNNEKRSLQEACDALFDNARRSHPVTGPRRKPLKSLTDALKGKQGRFRRNLLGKRVDYSGRSVICVGLDLQLHECGLPKKIALELFKPFVMQKLIDRKIAEGPRHARQLVERRNPVVWDQLAECMHEKVVLLNRAPTLHRLSIQAFEPRLVEGDAIRLHPLVCSAFNADFDGDQMAVHLPLSDEAQTEARQLLLSIRNLRSPATGDPTITLSQEIVLGCFYLTEGRPGKKQDCRVYSDANEAQLAYEQGSIGIHTPIIVRVPDQQIYDAPPPVNASSPLRGRIETTVGRLIFNAVLPAGLRYRNYPMTKDRLKQLITESLDHYGEDATAHLADALKRLGFHYATRSGISFGMSDMQEPPEKRILVAEGQARSQEIHALFQEGTITQDERDRSVIALWTDITDRISAKLVEHLDPFGTLSTIITSGCTKAKFQQIRQLSGIRGLMAGPSGRIIPIPVLGNYRVGLLVWEIFIAASGARKGFMDRSLNTAQSGYLTRKLVEVGMDVWTTMHDCGTHEGWLISNEESQGSGLPDFRSRVIGRVLAEPVAGLSTGTLLDEHDVERICVSGITALRVRSPFTCQADYGICCRCYGRDLATGKLVKRSVAVGIIAGQSIGEPGTQLTMRTFHSGGIANAQGDITQGLPRVNELFEAWVPKRAAFLAEIDGTVQIEKRADTGKTIIRLVNDDASAPINHQTKDDELPPGQPLIVENGQVVTIGTPLTGGSCNPRHILDLQGREATARYLINEVQRVYRATGVSLSDKHIEVIVRQMLRHVQISEPGDTILLPGDLIDRCSLIHTNEEILAQGGDPAQARPALLGLTRTALQTASWVAAASFQETGKVLTNAAIRGQIDSLKGYKERVVLGARIPGNLV
ncbi:MAG: DNA-directed RNA polymerase subunit beta' [Ktedonobacteraceae bacterium]